MARQPEGPQLPEGHEPPLHRPVRPVASIVLFGVVALFYVVESSIFGGATTEPA